METSVVKPNRLSNILVRVLSFVFLIFLARFAYVITLRSNSCDSGTVESPNTFTHMKSSVASLEGIELPDGESASWIKSYYLSAFQDLIADGYLSSESKALCIETLTGQDVAALQEIGVHNSIGISSKPSSPAVVSGRAAHQPFKNSTFDFEFSSGLERTPERVRFAAEVQRTLKSGGFFVVHTSATDEYSLKSLLNLFETFRFIRSRTINSVGSTREVILMKENRNFGPSLTNQTQNDISENLCSVQEYKRDLIRNVEPLITEEPLKPWITFKRNMKNIRYLPSIVDISFKSRYAYIDVGARNYGSSIGNWFQKQYPKQNKVFEIFAIEADPAFHHEYQNRKRVTLLPYAAWTRNETLFFEIRRNRSRKDEERGRGMGMGRVQSAQSSLDFVNDFNKIEGFDFAHWLKGSVSDRDFVVVKMDVEGCEFHLIPKLVESGAICLIDEFFVECHYNKWQRCCPGQRSLKYQKSYGECLNMFSSLRDRGLFVHQWW